MARLIYRAFVARGVGGPYLDEDSLITFPAALDLHARIAQREMQTVPAMELTQLCSGDACQVIYPDEQPPASDSETPPDPPPDKPKPSAFSGYASGEKREIYARMMAFISAHGLGARRMIAEASNGTLALSDVQNMTDAVPTPLKKWRAAAEAMDRLENEETEN